MILGVLKENHFQRVAIVPSTFKKLKQLQIDVQLESGAGTNASFLDSQYTEGGATLATRAQILSSSDIVVSISPLSNVELSQLKHGSLYISMLAPYQDETVVPSLAPHKINVVSMDMIPRTTLAQSMDVLSSMASLAGYKAVLVAADTYQNMFPMMMTAAGTIPPTKVLILGAGVAGLQAIATAKRLGAVIEVFDTRAAAKEEVKSLGATFVEVPGAADDKGAGGYAVQQSEEYLAKQRALVQEKAIKSNIIIATAQVRGRKAPLLITEETINQMRPGSVIVDLAASTGGNCAYTKNNACITHNGISIIGNSDLADQVASIASTLFANNVVNFLQMFVKEGQINYDMDNEIMKSALISKSE
jgi:H+-translocating NAD(P) transhydrogenase subunit alpha